MTKIVTQCEHIDKPYFAKGLCARCYHQTREALRPARFRIKLRKCVRCQNRKLDKEFQIPTHNNAYGRPAWKRICVVCDVPEKHETVRKILQRKHVIGKHGLTVDEYQKLFLKQKMACAICCCLNKKLCIDHNHTCCPGTNGCKKCVRGLLCVSCNSAIGQLGESPDNFHRALEYLCQKP